MLRFRLTILAPIGIALAFCLFAAMALADPPAKPKNPGPLDIPDSQVLKMSIDQYIDAYTKKHNGNINEPETRDLCYYYAALSRDRNLQLAKRLSPSRRRLVSRCQTAFDNLSQACEQYQYDSIGGTMVYDFYASLEVDNEAAMYKVVNDLRVSHGSNCRFRHDANRAYLAAWKALLESRSLLSTQDYPSWTTSKERLKEYRVVKSTLRKARTVLNSLPDTASRDFTRQLEAITNTLNAQT